jgi:MarR family 2-MHQ and catechol resistance regulon transcriptional repressor
MDVSSAENVSVSQKTKRLLKRNRCYTWPHSQSTDRRRGALAAAGRDDENIRDAYAVKAARAYASVYDWSDQAAIEACISVNNTHTKQMAALARLCDTLGMTRTVGRHALLRILYFSPERRMTQVEVANEMQVTSANITFLVDGLEKAQLVRRVPSQTDRRTVYVELTEAGQLLTERLVPSMARFMARLMEGFSEEEKQTLSTLLGRMRRNAETFELRSLD